MARIQVLSPHTANQIAAGEVVERPASVVKELVENALDAQATCITVEIKDGGIAQILVIDNGCGMDRDDCERAFLRHATSKIASIEDLGTLSTMGFRGEALASIASVSVVTMTTKTSDNDIGTRVRLEGGIVVEKGDVAYPNGTTMQVNELFANVPARLHFLKTKRAEAGAVGDYMARMILSHPDVSFRYLCDGSLIYETYGDGKLFEAIFQVYGASVTEHLLPIHLDNAYLCLDGYIGEQCLTRPNRSFQSFFINGRYVRSQAISSAVMRAYDTRIMNGRFPFFVLNMRLSPHEMDINVHPAKMEVRFVDEGRISSAIYTACRDALLSQDRAIVADDHANAESERRLLQDIAGSQIMTDNAVSATAIAGHTILTSGIQRRNSSYEMNERPLYSSFMPTDRAPSAVPHIYLDAKRDPPTYQRPKPIRIMTDDDSFSIVGCLFQTYWLVTLNDDIYLIDQHAAHERRLYERFRSREISFVPQELLIPISVSLTPSEMNAVQDSMDLLNQIGFRLSVSSALTVQLESVPAVNGVTLEEPYLHDLLSELMEGRTPHAEDAIRDRLIQTACKHAVKAGEALTRDEIAHILSDYASDGTPLTCPHGRPVIIRYHKRDIEKLFKRIV